VSPFEFAHGFPARVPLTFGQASAQAPPGKVLDIGAAAISNWMKMRHWAAADHMTAAQACLGHLLARRSRPATLNVACQAIAFYDNFTPEKSRPIKIEPLSIA